MFKNVNVDLCFMHCECEWFFRAAQAGIIMVIPVCKSKKLLKATNKTKRSI